MFTAMTLLAAADNPPTITKPAVATPAIITGKTTKLAVGAVDERGTAVLKYKWSATGPAEVKFSTTNVMAVSATFTAIGTYTFTVTVTDGLSQSITSSVEVTVTPLVSTLSIAPSMAVLEVGAVTQFSATAKDQFGTVIAEPVFSWTAKGAATVDANGVCTAGKTPGAGSVSVTSGMKTESATLRIAPAGAKGAISTTAADTSSSSSLSTKLLPANRLGNWTEAGVPGGIPPKRTKLIDVSKPPYNADLSGNGDAQPAIMQAIAAAIDDEVVYLPAGIYRINSPIAFKKNKISIRGDGPDKTILRGYNSDRGGTIDINFLLQARGFYQGTRFPIIGSPVKGATVLNVNTSSFGSFPRGGVGQICQIALKNDMKLPVVTTAGGEYLRQQVTRITAVTPISITISPPLLFDLPEALAPNVLPSDGQVELVGIEDLCIDGANCRTSHSPLTMGQSFACWLNNVSVINVPKWHFLFTDSLQCDIRNCHLAKRTVPMGPDGGGLMFMGGSSFLVEDNVLCEAFPLIELTHSSGNVFAYNYCDDRSIHGDLLGGSIITNHGGHPSFNLYEGNVAPKVQCDGYHSGGSDDTLFRNWFHGTSAHTKNFWVCVNLNRFTRNYSIIGNVLGHKDHSWIYEATNGFGLDSHIIYAFGLPGMGNGGFSGMAQLSKGKPWAQWEQAKAGQWPGPYGFQELDLDVRATTILKGNFNFADKGVPAAESLGGIPLPKSLYLTKKPTWFGALAWPAFGPDADPDKNKIPAQVRYEAMKK